MKTQPEALRHADTLEHWNPGDPTAAELRRLHAANIDCVDHFNALKAERDELLEALHKLSEAADDSDGCQYGTLSTSFVRDIARAAIDKATGGQA